jgi:hypothetical protein
VVFDRLLWTGRDRIVVGNGLNGRGNAHLRDTRANNVTYHRGDSRIARTVELDMELEAKGGRQR